MIYVIMGGRLGNQLFRYAYARKLMKENPSEHVCFDFSGVKKRGKPEEGWENSLKYFNTIDTETECSALKLSIIQRIVLKLYSKHKVWPNLSVEKHHHQMKWAKLMSRVGLYYLDVGYYPFPQKKPWFVNNLVVSSGCESENYFKGIRDILLEEFTPKQSVLESNRELMHIIRNNNSVCISIRRGDFISVDRINKIYNICSPEYYLQAMARIKELVDNPIFVLFSDDIEWVKNNIHVDGECYYESGDDPIWEKLRLMYSCKHFIISNSTFSWWAQYLGQSQDKVVVAPSRWYKNKLVPALYQDNWEIIDV